MHVFAIKTELFHPGQDLNEFVLRQAGSYLRENTILAVTSKIVSLAENRTVPLESIEKGDLVRRESDHYLGEIGYGCHLTIKHGLFIPSAGIDESNAEGKYYILYPENPFASAEKICSFIKEKIGLKNFGVILTDSHTQPLRRGVIGACLAYWGFEGVKNMVGTRDLFGRELKMTRINYADALAVSTTMLMGEGAERTPLAVAENSGVNFRAETHPEELLIPVQEDLYYPFFKNFL